MPKQKYKTMYMHTLDGKPAQFLDDGQNQGIFHIVGYQKVTLSKSLAEIRKQQKVDLASDHPCVRIYGYRLVKVPA